MAVKRKIQPKYTPPQKLIFKTGGAVIELYNTKPINTHRSEEWYDYKYILTPVKHPKCGSPNEGKTVSFKKANILEMLEKGIAKEYENTGTDK